MLQFFLGFLAGIWAFKLYSDYRARRQLRPLLDDMMVWLRRRDRGEP